jgi:hypothetical protein
VRTARACEKIAAAALSRDPDNEAALWLYTFRDFLKRVGKKGPPIPTPSIELRIAKIERIVALFGENQVHIPSLETIVIDHPEVLDAMISAFEHAPAGRGRRAFIQALGGTLVDHQRVLDLFVRELEAGRDIDDIAMAMHYGLRAKAVPALGVVMALASRLVDELEEGQDDWRHVWPLQTTVSLARRARGKERASAQAFLRRLRNDAAIPAWKREKLVCALS